MLIMVPLRPTISYNATPRVTLLRPHSSGNICIVPVQVQTTLTSIPFHRCVAREEWRAGRREAPGPSRKSIYLFIYVPRGGSRADEGVRGPAYSRRMHRTGNPTGATVRDEGDGKSHGELSCADTRLRLRTFPEARLEYTGCLLIRTFNT